MEYRVKLLPRAQRDIEGLYKWVVQRASHQGHDWYNGLMRAIRSLASHPQRCPMAPEASALKEPIRHLLYGARPYRILFWIKGNCVEVLHIRRAARDAWRRK
jgi:plasmid stabilization system protein ParE